MADRLWNKVEVITFESDLDYDRMIWIVIRVLNPLKSQFSLDFGLLTKYLEKIVKDSYIWGYWRQRADERLGDSLSLKVHLGASSGQRQGWPLRGNMEVHCFCVCSGSALLGDLGVSRSVERDFLSVLSIYPGIFLTMFTRILSD